MDWYRIFRPHHWLRNYPYSPVWDRFILEGIATKNIKITDRYTAIIGGEEVWIENYPYAFGRTCSGYRVMPSAKTVDLLRDVLVAL